MDKFTEDTRFPDDISYGSSGGPEFSTEIIKLSGGTEQRRINHVHARNRYNVVYDVKSYHKFSLLLNFFCAHRGKAIPFRFKDWSDYKAVNQQIGNGNGELSDFQLLKHYSHGRNSYVRTITKPVTNTVEIFLDGKQVEHGRDYAVNLSSGVVSFGEPPVLNASISATFEFDVFVRFDTDFLPCSLNDYENYGCGNIPLVEVGHKQ